MPSPFPGMDPFLEHPSIFPDLHDRMVSKVSEMLNSQLPAPYYTGVGRAKGTGPYIVYTK
ncbi:MAG: DUF4058 family protein [Planctomycetes bacterium]|nr:DUF4058 family protein [Planctomycetota bacterium]